MNRGVCILGGELDSIEPDVWTYFVTDQRVDLPESDRLKVYFIQTLFEQRFALEDIAFRSLGLRLEISASEGWETMQQKLEATVQAAQQLLFDVADGGVASFSNALVNLKEIAPCKSLEAMKGCFRDVPVLVCGAGSSLSMVKDLLPALEHRALVFAAGTAVSLLGSWAIRPHLCFAIDSRTPLSTFLPFPFAETPCCLQSRLAPSCVSLIHGEKILAPETGPLPWERWWFEPKESFSFGWTVGNFTLEAARWMGCNPIIAVGMDGCYVEGNKYPEGNNPTKAPLVETTNVQGRKVWTQSDWLVAAAWCRNMVSSHPDTRFYSLAKEGLDLGMQLLSPHQFQDLLGKQRDLQGALHLALQHPRLHLDPEKEVQFQESVERCLQTKEFDREIAYRYYLEPLWRIWEPIFEREALGEDLSIHRLLFFQKILHNLQHVHISSRTLSHLRC